MAHIYGHTDPRHANVLRVCVLRLRVYQRCADAGAGFNATCDNPAGVIAGLTSAANVSAAAVLAAANSTSVIAAPGATAGAAAGSTAGAHSPVAGTFSE